MGKRNKDSSKGQNRNKLNKKSFNNGFGSSKSALNKNLKTSTNPDRDVEKGNRSRNTIKRLKMYAEKPKAPTNKIEVRSNKSIRIDPNRKYFGNTRTIDSKTLESLRKEYEQSQSSNKVNILLRRHKVPISLVSSNKTKTTNTLLEPFHKTFGPGSLRKKPKLLVSDIEDLAKQSEELIDKYDIEKDSEQQKIEIIEQDEKKDNGVKYMNAGQSKRIYSELHKVIDSSDVLCYVIDARDPMGTRSTYVENFIKNHCPYKHIVFILNKCDLVPTWITSKWVKLLSKSYPTLVFHASLTNPFGKPALFQTLRQFDVLHRDKKHISVGFIGYPNVGKSSVINTLKKQACCRSAPIPGETRVWQYVSLTKRIYLIDCPGVVYDSGDSDTDKILKNVLRAEKIEDPALHIGGILDKVKKEHMQKLYGVVSWEDHEDFVSQVAVKYGKLKRGGEGDSKVVAKMILMDWQRGKIPYYADLPKEELDNINSEGNDIDMDNNNINNNDDNNELTNLVIDENTGEKVGKELLKSLKHGNKNKNIEFGIDQDLDELKKLGGNDKFEDIL